MSFIEYVGAVLIIYLLNSVFFLFLAIGSLEYHIAISKPSERDIDAFLTSLKFPFNLLSFGDRPKLLSHFARVTPNEGMGKRIFSCIIPLLLVMMLLSVILRSTDPKGKAFGIAVVVTHLVTVLGLWNFGKRLKVINENDIQRR